MEYNSATEWGGVSWFCNINIASTGVTLGIIAGCTAEVFPANDGYYRVCVYITTGASPSGTNYSYLLRMNGGSGTSVLTAGGQLEANSIASSFINTTAGAVTANADVISKTGMSALLTGAKGFFVDCYLQASSLTDGVARYAASLYVDGNTYISIFRLNNVLQFDVANGGAFQAQYTATITAPTKNKRLKAFIYFDTNDIRFYLNGALLASDTGATFTVPYTAISAGSYNGSNLFWDGLLKAPLCITDSLSIVDIDQLTQYNSLEEMASEMVYTYED